MSLPRADQPFADEEEDRKRKAEIEEMMRSQREFYFRNEPVQQEYRDVVTRLADREEARRNVTANGYEEPGPFDLALAQFLKIRGAAGANPNSAANPRPQFASLGVPAGVTLPDDGAGDANDHFSSEGTLNRAARAASANAAESSDGQSASPQPYGVAQNDVPAGTSYPRPDANDTSWLFDGGEVEARSIFRRDTENAHEAAKTVPDGGVGKGDRLPISRPPDAPPWQPETLDQGSDRRYFDQRTKGAILEGKWDVITREAQKNNIPPRLLAAVMNAESGLGRKIGKKGTTNNPGGLMVPASKNQTEHQTFNSIDAGIAGTARIVARNWRVAGGDLAKMRDNYAPLKAKNDPKGLNNNWLDNVTKTLEAFEREAYKLRAVRDATVALNRPNDPVSSLPNEEERTRSPMRDAIQTYLKLR